MRYWAEKVLLSAALITLLIFTADPPYKEKLAVLGPLILGTTWHYLGKYAVKTEGDNQS